jgi:hypothetical protein
MNVWRMKLRAGHRGHDMFPACEKRGIASYTHKPIYNTSLTRLEKGDVDPAVKGPARSSIWLFAWEIKGGDEIYVGDSKSHKIIAKGVVAGKLGKRAYHYNSGSALKEPSGVAWRHEVPVEWQKNFTPFPYKDPAPRHSVYKFKPLRGDGRNDITPTSILDGENESDALLNDQPYGRETAASKKNISRQHVSLSNQFRLWLERKFAVKVRQERKGVDLTFTTSTFRHLAELKICYRSDTRHAIREAMGQLLEYNHYPPREEAQFWWLVLDCEPSQTDRKYISSLIEKYMLPLTVAWLSGGDFETFPSLPLKTQKHSAKARSES